MAVRINGDNIGLSGTDDDLMTIGNAILTVAGEVQMTTLDIGGTNVAATAAELNIMDGNASIGTTAVSDGHGIVMNHGGTMAQTTVQTLAAYLDDEITAMPNLVTVGTIGSGVWNAGAVTSSGAIAGTTGTFSSTAQATVITATTGFAPDAQDGAYLGTSSLQFSDLFLADAAVISFGDDNEITLTHSHNVGLILEGNGVTETPTFEIKNTNDDATGGWLKFNKNTDDSAAANDVLGSVTFHGEDADENATEYARIQAQSAAVTAGSEAGKLLLGVATTGSGAYADVMTITGGANAAGSTVAILGNLTVAGTTTTENTTIIESTVTVLQFEGASDNAHETTFKVVEPTADTSFSLPALNAGDYFIPAIAGVQGAAEGTVTAAEFLLLDGGSSIGTTAVSDGHGIVMNQGGTMGHTTVQTLAAYLDDEITNMPNLSSAAALATVGTITSGVWNAGAVTSSGAGSFAGAVSGTTGTFSSTAQGTVITATTGFAPDAQDGAYLGTSSLQFSDLFLADGAVISFGDDNEIKLTHVADSGLTLSHETTGDNLPIILTLESSEAILIVDEVIGQIDFKATDSDGGDGALVCAGIAAVAEDTFSATVNSTKLSFKTATTAVAAETMKLGATGLLTLNGAGGCIVLPTSTGDGVGQIGCADDTNLLSLTSGNLGVAGTVGCTGATASGTMTAATFATSSDLRLKRNVQTIDNALDMVATLRGVTYDWRESSKADVGFIAQEVQEILPQLVHEHPETGYLTMEYGKLTGLLVEAVKEQQEEIKSLRSQQGQIDELKAMVVALMNKA